MDKTQYKHLRRKFAQTPYEEASYWVHQALLPMFDKLNGADQARIVDLLVRRRDRAGAGASITGG